MMRFHKGFLRLRRPERIFRGYPKTMFSQQNSEDQKTITLACETKTTDKVLDYYMILSRNRGKLQDRVSV